jgi:hypothetical protein
METSAAAIATFENPNASDKAETGTVSDDTAHVGATLILHKEDTIVTMNNVRKHTRRENLDGRIVARLVVVAAFRDETGDDSNDSGIACFLNGTFFVLGYNTGSLEYRGFVRRQSELRRELINPCVLP